MSTHGLPFSWLFLLLLPSVLCACGNGAAPASKPPMSDAGPQDVATSDARDGQDPDVTPADALSDPSPADVLPDAHPPVDASPDAVPEPSTLLSLGAQKSCRRDGSGAIACWGRNQHGELGLGVTGEGKTRPEPVGSETDWETISAGGFHVCATKTSGALHCWGLNSTGQVGDGSGTDRTAPTRVGTDVDWDLVAAGGYHTCGIRKSGSLWCWGWNSFGEVGQGTQGQGTDAFEPVQVATGQSFRSVAAGDYHACAIASDGSLWCWGANGAGQVGNGGGPDVLTPTRVGLFNDWRVVTAGQYHTCGLRQGGALWCWGANDKGQCGVDEPGNVAEPRAVDSPALTTVAAGQQHTCGIDAGGSLWCFGFNESGQLGIGSHADVAVPTQVEPGTVWRSIAAGDWHTCGEQADGTLHCWGWNHFGQLGNGTTEGAATPTPL